jgi:hypothetical protein
MLAALLGAGCGDRLVEGGYFGDATLRLHGIIAGSVGNPAHGMVGAAWLGYSGLIDPTAGVETTALPITSIQFPPNFECDVLDPPSSTGRYAAHQGGVIPASIRLARLVLFDDVDADGRYALDPDAHVLPPDELLATSTDFALLFVERPPDDPGAADGPDSLIDNWEAATPGYHVVALDPMVPKPDLAGHVVSNDSLVIFTTPIAGAAF